MVRRLSLAVVAFCLLTSCSREQSESRVIEAADVESYAPMCRAALVAAKEFSRRLRTSSVTDAPPVLVSAGPPVRIRCQFKNREGLLGEVTADLKCLDQFDRTCVQPVTASLDGKIVQGPGRVGPDRWP